MASQLHDQLYETRQELRRYKLLYLESKRQIERLHSELQEVRLSPRRQDVEIDSEILGDLSGPFSGPRSPPTEGQEAFRAHLNAEHLDSHRVQEQNNPASRLAIESLQAARQIQEDRVRASAADDQAKNRSPMQRLAEAMNDSEASSTPTSRANYEHSAEEHIQALADARVSASLSRDQLAASEAWLAEEMGFWEQNHAAAGTEDVDAYVSQGFTGRLSTSSFNSPRFSYINHTESEPATTSTEVIDLLEEEKNDFDAYMT